jgi:hypothetical protein
MPNQPQDYIGITGAAKETAAALSGAYNTSEQDEPEYGGDI